MEPIPKDLRRSRKRKQPPQPPPQQSKSYPNSNPNPFTGIFTRSKSKIYHHPSNTQRSPEAEPRSPHQRKHYKSVKGHGLAAADDDISHMSIKDLRARRVFSPAVVGEEENGGDVDFSLGFDKSSDSGKNNEKGLVSTIDLGVLSVESQDLEAPNPNLETVVNDLTDSDCRLEGEADLCRRKLGEEENAKGDKLSAELAFNGGRNSGEAPVKDGSKDLECGANDNGDNLIEECVLGTPENEKMVETVENGGPNGVNLITSLGSKENLGYSGTKKSVNKLGLNSSAWRKVFKSPSSFNYRRMLPYLMEMETNESIVSEIKVADVVNTCQNDGEPLSGVDNFGEEHLQTTPPDVDIFSKPAFENKDVDFMPVDDNVNKKLSNGINKDHGNIIGLHQGSDQKIKTTARNVPVLNPCSRAKLFRNQGSVSYRRLLPFLKDIAEEKSYISGESSSQSLIKGLKDKPLPPLFFSAEESPRKSETATLAGEHPGDDLVTKTQTAALASDGIFDNSSPRSPTVIFNSTDGTADTTEPYLVSVKNTTMLRSPCPALNVNDLFPGNSDTENFPKDDNLPAPADGSSDESNLGLQSAALTCLNPSLRASSTNLVDSSLEGTNLTLPISERTCLGPDQSEATSSPVDNSSENTSFSLPIAMFTSFDQRLPTARTTLSFQNADTDGFPADNETVIPTDASFDDSYSNLPSATLTCLDLSLPAATSSPSDSSLEDSNLNLPIAVLTCPNHNLSAASSTPVECFLDNTNLSLPVASRNCLDVATAITAADNLSEDTNLSQSSSKATCNDCSSNHTANLISCGNVVKSIMPSDSGIQVGSQISESPKKLEVEAFHDNANDVCEGNDKSVSKQLALSTSRHCMVDSTVDSREKQEGIDENEENPMITAGLDEHGVQIKALPPSGIQIHCATRGILKRNPRGCRGICECLNCASFRLHAERAFEFSKNQMQDAEEVALELMQELAHLRNMLEKSSMDADDHAVVCATQAKEACKKALEAEEQAKMRLNQMNEDLSIHCRIKHLQRPKVTFSNFIEEKVILERPTTLTVRKKVKDRRRKSFST